MVGGIPRRAGLRQYLDATNPPVAPGLWMVGDSIFPGQGTYAAATGGVRTVERALAKVRFEGAEHDASGSTARA